MKLRLLLIPELEEEEGRDEEEEEEDLKRIE